MRHSLFFLQKNGGKNEMILAQIVNKKLFGKK